MFGLGQKQWKGERLALKTLGPQRKSFNALGTTRSTWFAEMFLGENFVCFWLSQGAIRVLGRCRPITAQTTIPAIVAER